MLIDPGHTEDLDKVAMSALSGSDIELRLEW